MEPRRLLDEGTQQAWIGVAHAARAYHRLLTQLPMDPLPKSNLRQVDDFYPFEKVSTRARAYLDAALEHLLLWADYAAPLKFHPDQEINFTLRPAHTLARAAMEASAQAVWLMSTRDPKECVRRHLSLMRWDLQEQRKSRMDQNDKEFFKLKEAELINRVSQVFTEVQIAPPTSYLGVIRSACEPTDLDVDPNDAERLWRAASGAAHGKYWPNVDLKDVEVGEEYEPGHFRSRALPSASRMTEVLEQADKMTAYGVLRFAHFAGADVGVAMAAAIEWVADQIPIKPDASRAELKRTLEARHTDLLRAPTGDKTD
jgi:hypothetical protein